MTATVDEIFACACTDKMTRLIPLNSFRNNILFLQLFVVTEQ